MRQLRSLLFVGVIVSARFTVLFDEVDEHDSEVSWPSPTLAPDVREVS